MSDAAIPPTAIAPPPPRDAIASAIAALFSASAPAPVTAPAPAPATEPPHDDPTPPRPAPNRRRSRLNACKHGLTAAVPVGVGDAALMREFTANWVEQLAPQTDAEHALIQAAAAAYARLERCNTAEEDARHDVARAAVARWEKRQRHQARKTAQGLAADPHNTVLDLEDSSFGCEWLMRHWAALDAVLAQGLRWDAHDQCLAMRLLGLRPQSPGPDGEPAAVRFWHLLRVASGMPVDPRPGGPVLPSEPVPARAALRRTIAAEFDRLAALRDEHQQRHDRFEVEAVARAAVVDTSKEGQLRQRYRREAFSELVRGLKEATRLRSERAKLDDRRRAREEAPPRDAAGLDHEIALDLDLDRDLDGDLGPGLDVVGDFLRGLGLDPDPGRRLGDEPPGVPCPTAAAVDSRNEPAEEAPESTEDHRKSDPDNDLRGGNPKPFGDAARRTVPHPGSHGRPIGAVATGRSAPRGGPIGPRSSPSAADRAG